MSIEFYEGANSGSDCGSGGGSAGEEHGAGIGTGDGAGDAYPPEATYGDESNWGQSHEQTAVTLQPGVYVVTQPTPIILPRGSHLVTPFLCATGRGSGSGNGARTIEPNDDEGLITPDKDEALLHVARVPGGVMLQSGDGSGQGRGGS